jgi:7,8-dihydropterin-6-yl-methyl-4-(beta-D-ribofuranosyl)aminobenzene 5'-phosphate synthase
MKNLFWIAIFALIGLSLIALLFFGIRQAHANREIEAEWQAVLPDAPALSATSHLEIIPLYEEAKTGDELVSGHGVSYLIRTDSGTILMDVGNNPDNLVVAPFIQNMQSLGISPEEIGAVLISHPHPDHLGGEQAWRRKTISFGEVDTGLGELPVYAPTRMTYPGVITMPEPTLISLEVATIGVISYPEVFPLSLIGEAKGGEQALVVNVAGQGLVLITGCGHPTLERLVERAEGLYDLPVIGVVGGLHYERASAQDVEPHIQFLQTRHPKLVALSPHDSSPQALAAFRSAFSQAYQDLMVGSTIKFPVH